MSEDVIQLHEVAPKNPNLTVIGVGGGGGSAVYRMNDSNLVGVNYIVTNTDRRALSKHKGPHAIELGVGITAGRGAGARPDIGEQAAIDSSDEIKAALEGIDMLFITAGFGGGTGTGAAPIIANIAKEMGVLTIAFVTKPFYFEGKKKLRVAQDGIQKMRETVYSVVVISNQKLLEVAGKNLNMLDAFKKVDEVLCQAVRGVTDLITVPGLINVDFNDMRTVMLERGHAVMGKGESDGPNRIVQATQQAFSNPLIDDASIHGAKGVLINVTGANELTLTDVAKVGEMVHELVDEDANIVFGTAIDESMGDSVSVTVFATGIESQE